MANDEDRAPAWVKAQRQQSAAAAQLVRGRISTLENDTLFWIEFDNSGPRAFNRILCRKVGDAANSQVEMSWQSMTDSPIADLDWKPAKGQYPPNDCNPTMRLVEMDEQLQANLAMLIVHSAWDVVRQICRDTHNNALLCRAQAARRDGLT
jgi:hypothetical protein